MWNGLRTQEALEGGVFTRRAFIDVGEAGGEPLPYQGRKEQDRDVYHGKQFAIAATKTGHLPKDYLDPVSKPLFEGEPWRERLPYHEMQPVKPPKGFQTSDYSKRDEFSLTTRMEQHREQIKHEKRMQKEAEEKLARELGKGGSGGGGGAADGAPAGAEGGDGSAERKGAKEKPLLYDLVYGHDVALCIHAKRDTTNPTALSPERDLGPLRTTAGDAHADPGVVAPPKHGIRQVPFT